MANTPTPKPVTIKPIEVEPDVADDSTPLELLTKQVTDIQKHFNGESNIPVGHEYWQLLNRMRAIISGNIKE